MEIRHVLVGDLSDRYIINADLFFSIRCRSRSSGPSKACNFTAIPIISPLDPYGNDLGRIVDPKQTGMITHAAPTTMLLVSI